MTPTKTTLSALLCAALLAAGNAGAAPGTLTVTLKQVGEAPGNLRVSLYSDPATFRKEDKALQVIALPAKSGQVQLAFRDVPAGRYAIVVYHDANADGKLNRHLGMIPTEGYGLSNNPQVFGPPKFADSAFDVGAEGAAIDIKLTY